LSKSWVTLRTVFSKTRANVRLSFDGSSIVPADRLGIYARHCLEAAFDKNGLALQDIGQ
jgi:hypothetical protein